MHNSYQRFLFCFVFMFSLLFFVLWGSTKQGLRVEAGGGGQKINLFSVSSGDQMVYVWPQPSVRRQERQHRLARVHE